MPNVKAGNKVANGMSNKVGYSSHDHNGAPIKGLHKADSMSNGSNGTNGHRVNGH